MGKQTKNNRKKEQRFDPFMLVDIALHVCIAYLFFQIWATPSESDVDKIYALTTLILFEFIMVHSGILMAAFPPKFSIFIFFPFYGLFAWCFNQLVPDNSIMYLYLGVVLNRMRFAFFNADKETKRQNILWSVYACSIYIVLFLSVHVLSGKVPELGLTPDFLDRAAYSPSGIGAMYNEPKIAMCIGMLYYIMLALFNVAMFGISLKNLVKRITKQ